MLDELNGLIDQNSRLVKEVDDLRRRLAQREEGEVESQPNCDEEGNPILYTEKDLQIKLAEDREAVQS